MFKPRSPEDVERDEILAQARTEEQALRDAEDFAERVHSSCPVEGCIHLDSYEPGDELVGYMEREPSPYEFDTPDYWPFSGVGC